MTDGEEPSTRSFDRLHPAVQHHIVNSLGWRSLRPLQEDSVDPLLAGEHALLLAPTAGGKTEAAIFPLLSRMLQENWRGLSVLYVCPIKALLNNLEPRLAKYASLLGRRVGLWHGDVGPSARKRLISDPPDILLTTPESIEVMLIFRRDDRDALFRNIRALVVDELHAFAGDDRGWHLLAVTERVTRVCGREIQRVGLSATIGNPDALLEWLAGSCQGPRRVIAPPAEATAEADVTLDFVGSIENAAIVISRLHRGEKRLVFCDSRSRVEELSAELRNLGVQTFVSHSSLSVDERKRAEAAFQEASNCVIVATSTLELGVDVGDLDRVIQIDSPPTVASFLQRIGRTGRRPGSSRNCLFLATKDEAFLQSAALVRLWKNGFVEPVEPPAKPLHILAQQLMALTLQEGQIGRHTWHEWVAAMPGFASQPREDLDAVVDHMVTTGILAEEQGLLSMGPKGEELFGRKNFIELCSVFSSPPLFQVLHGRKELGQVHQRSFQVPPDQKPVLLLAGRSWTVNHLDWPRRIAQVEPTKGERGKSRWLGSSLPLHSRLCRAVRSVLADGEVPVRLTKRAQEKLEELLADYSWVQDGTTALVRDPKGLRWWTFAGLLANATLSELLGAVSEQGGQAENLAIRLRADVDLTQLEAVVSGFPAADVLSVPVPAEAAEGLKFSVCLPPHLLEANLSAALADADAVTRGVQEPLRAVTVAD
ncbi:MAG TPA: ATP-dependent helicase [Planctomycetes bacterium]|nr:ATP-dependent helicase [Planctomycetota bacterium]